MPASTPRRRLTPTSSRAQTRREARAPYAGGSLLHARRCLTCGAPQHHYKPARAKAVEAATVVARLAVHDGVKATSADIAPHLGAATRPIRANTAAEHLAHAWEDGLLERQRVTLATGGTLYLYSPRIELAAYVEQDTLAVEVCALFGHDLRLALAGIEQSAKRARRLSMRLRSDVQRLSAYPALHIQP